jgi:hypothetical protein
MEVEVRVRVRVRKEKKLCFKKEFENQAYVNFVFHRFFREL